MYPPYLSRGIRFTKKTQAQTKNYVLIQMFILKACTELQSVSDAVDFVIYKLGHLTSVCFDLWNLLQFSLILWYPDCCGNIVIKLRLDCFSRGFFLLMKGVV